MRILVLVHSCIDNLDRIEAVKNTWWNDVKSPHKIFICGDIDLYNKYGHNQVWLCASGVNGRRMKLPIRSLNMFRIALNDPDWDLLYKCDDDTYLEFNRLLNDLYDNDIDMNKPLYSGAAITNLQNKTSYAQGGAGYLLNRKAIIAAWNNLERVLSEENAEDRGVGQAMFDSNISLLINNKFNPGKFKSNDAGEYAVNHIMNGGISCHYITPKYMYHIYDKRVK